MLNLAFQWTANLSVEKGFGVTAQSLLPVEGTFARKADYPIPQPASGVTPRQAMRTLLCPFPRRLGSLSAFLDTLRRCLRVWREVRAAGRPARYTDTICVQLAACGRPGR